MVPGERFKRKLGRRAEQFTPVKRSLRPIKASMREIRLIVLRHPQSR